MLYLWFSLYYFYDINIIKQNMETYCLICRKNTDNANSKVIKTKNGRLQLKSQCSICGNKKSRFVSEKEGPGILSYFGIRTLLSKIPGINVLF